jgi:hypothetical protein
MSVAAVWLRESQAGSSGEVDVRACWLERASSGTVNVLKTVTGLDGVPDG